jgi:large subunit ribosomal protein L22
MSPTTYVGAGSRAERRRERHPNKTNERPGTRAQHRYARLSASKARVVLDLIRGKTIGEADEILAFVERDAAAVIRKVLDSAIANAEHNDEIPADELYVSACYADEGPTLKRWRPRARGRATRIRKRTCHITVIVSRLPAGELARIRAREEAAREARSGQGARAAGAAKDASEARRRRVEKSRQAKADAAAAREAEHDHDHDHDEDDEVAEVASADSLDSVDDSIDSVDDSIDSVDDSIDSVDDSIDSVDDSIDSVDEVEASVDEVEASVDDEDDTAETAEEATDTEKDQ